MPARTPVPPSVTAVVKRAANASTTADDSTKRSPPAPVAQEREDRDDERALVADRGSVVESSPSRMPYSSDELLEHGGIPLDLEVDGAAEPQHDVSHDADRIPALSRGWG